MWTPAAGFDLRVDGSCNLVSREQIRRAAVVPLVGVPGIRLPLVDGCLSTEELRHVVEHEAPPFRVPERPSVASDALGYEQTPDAGRPDHASRMELGHFHVDQVG